ncbi:MAG: DNA internalization-related competence protein ComEC/Rec2 [Armatimonadota bacterium]|nr:DNA internalization-related competence protein ComEC/Rec2 [Armatimonadota bacterium]
MGAVGPVRYFLDFPVIVWLTAAFGLGVALTRHRVVGPVEFGFLCGAAAGLWIAGRGSGSPSWRLAGVIVLGTALGVARAVSHERQQPVWPGALDGQRVIATGTVVMSPEATARGWRAVVRLHTIQAAGTSHRSHGARQPRGRLPPHPAMSEAARGLAPETPQTADTVRRVEGRVRVTGRGAPPGAVTPGSRVSLRGVFRAGRPAGNPGERSEREALRRRGLSGVIAVASGDGVVVERPGRWSVRALVAAVRRRVITVVLTALPEPQGGLLLSLLLGIDTHLDPRVYQQFSRAGLVHLMVVSGAQVAIVAGACAWLARALRLSVSMATVATGLGVAVFAGMIDWAPSIGRAVLMTAVAMGGVLIGRARDRRATLAAAALALLVANPESLFDIGFQLSFAATWGLLFLSPVLEARLAWCHPRVASALGVTLGAQAAVAPLLALHFQTLAVAGLAANVLVLPLIAALVPAGFAIIPLLVVAPTLGAPLLGMLRPGLAAILWIGQRFGELSWATVPVPPMSSGTGAIFLGLLGATVALGSGALPTSRAIRTTLAAVGVLTVGVWCAGAARPPTMLVVTVLDVGQGDAILIQSPSGHVVLVDGGGEVGAERTVWDVGRMRVVPALRRAGVRRIDVVVFSHPHEDHVGGLPAVVENFPVGLVLDPGVPHPSPSYTRLLRLVEAGRIPYRTARAGMTLDLGAGVALAILHPPEPIPLLDGDPVHAGGVIGRLTRGAAAMLLTGDAEAAAEQYLIERGAPLHSGVLKVGHHGSRTSTTPALLRAVRPRYAVISVGADNTFGHPHPATLAALEVAGAEVLRTDLDGAVRFSSDGAFWRVETARSRSHAGIR